MSSFNRRSEDAFAEKILSDEDLDALLDSDVTFEEREKLKQKVAEIDRIASIEEVQRFSAQNEKATQLLDKLFVKFIKKKEKEERVNTPPIPEIEIFPLIFPMIEKTIAATFVGSFLGYFFVNRAKIAEVKITPPPAKRAAIILGTGVLCGCIMAIHQMHKEFNNVARQINNPLGEVARVEYSKLRNIPYIENDRGNNYTNEGVIRNKE